MYQISNAPIVSEAGHSALLFGQLAEQLSNSDSFESFRALTMSSYARLTESIGVLRDLKRERVSEKTPKSFLQELVWSLKRDIAVQELEPALVGKVVKVIESNQEPIDDMITVLNLLAKKISGRSKPLLEKLIKEQIKVGKYRSKLRDLAGLYVAELINLGFDSKTINNRALSIILAPHPSEDHLLNSIDQFLNSFSLDLKQYSVAIKVNSEFGSALESVGIKVVELRDLPEPFLRRSGFEQPGYPSNVKAVLRKVDGIDEYDAASRSARVLQFITSLNFLGPEIASHKYGLQCLVDGERNSDIHLIDLRPPSFIRNESKGGRIEQYRFRRITKRVFESFDDRSTPRLAASLRIASQSETANTDTRILNLWSAVEVLLGNPPVRTARIVHYEENLVPAVCIRYIRRLMVGLYDSICLHSRNKLKNVLSKEAYVGRDAHTRLGAIFMIEENQPLRDELTKAFENNPLVLHQMYRVYEAVKSRPAVLKTLKSHQDRISWQIHRIYRARNQLAHIGVSPKNSLAIAVNLFEYYKAAVWTVMRHVERENDKSHLLTAIAEIKVEYELYCDYLKNKDNRINKDDVLNILQLKG